MSRSMTRTATNNVEVAETETVSAIKKFSEKDEIECVSITPGQLFVTGERSKDLYTFADIDDVQFIRYDDLMYMVRRKHPAVFKPRFIIQNQDFLDQNKGVEDVYSSLYSSADLKAILKLTPVQIRTKVMSLPEGAKDSLKTIVATMVDNKTFDSVQRIKVLDEIFGTDMLFKIAGN